METAYEKLVKVLSKEYGLTVRFEGTGACVDLKNRVMILPSMLSNEGMNFMAGFLDHEVGHVKATDANVEFPKDKLEDDLFRIIEDVRVDKSMSNYLLGCKANIEKTRILVYNTVKAKQKFAGLGRDALFSMDILEYLSGRFMLSELCPLAQKGIELAQDLFDKVDDLPLDYSGTAMVKKLAKKIAERWDKEDFDSPEPESQDGEGEGGSGDDGSESDSGDNQGHGKDDKGKGREKSKKSPKKKSEKVDKKKDKKKDKDSFGRGLRTLIRNGGLSSGEVMTKEAIDDLVENDLRNMSLNGKHIPFTTKFDKVFKTKIENPKKERDILESGRKVTNQLVRRLEKALLAKNRDRVVFERDRGKIDQRRLHGLVSGKSNKVFKKLVEAEKLDTAIYLLVDCSGSMSGSKLYAAKEAAACFSDCLERLGIPNEVAGFWADSFDAKAYDYAKNAEKKGVNLRPFNRIYETIYHHIVKGFDDTCAQGNFSGFESRGSNVDGESIMVAAKILAKRPEKRKILIVFSDGNPAACGDCDLLRKDLKDKVKEINDAGIQTIGIGIRTDAPKHFYPENIMIHDIRSLSTSTIMELQKILLDGMAGKSKKKKVSV